MSSTQQHNLSFFLLGKGLGAGKVKGVSIGVVVCSPSPPLLSSVFISPFGLSRMEN